MRVLDFHAAICFFFSFGEKQFVIIILLGTFAEEA